MTSGVLAQIDLTALQHNIARVRTYAPKAAILAMIKADAYGHGLLAVAQALSPPLPSSADGFGVARLEEALFLRQHGIELPILVMAGFLCAEELEKMSEFSISTVVHTLEQVQLLESTSLKEPVSVWLKMDTGMHRLGLPPAVIPEAYTRLLACDNVAKPMTLFSHLARSDELSSTMTQEQTDLFNRIVHAIPSAAKSIANSAAIMTWPQTHMDWVRPGIMLYGISPFANRVGADFDLQPVMTLKSHLIAVHTLSKGDAVSYGSTWICPEKMRVGVIAVGYADGYPRHARNGTPILVNGVRCALVGRVSMDLTTVDLRPCPQAKIGDPVVLWGEGLPIEEVAAAADTIAYELLCHVMSRVRFEYRYV